jgi:cellulose biosynthesis protein BcsQ
VTVPIVTFFNNKGGVGKTSLVYHTAWMLSELGRRVLVVDLDPQANLTAAFLPEAQLERLFDEGEAGLRSMFQAVKPLLKVGDIESPTTVPITLNLGLVPGDLALARFEDALAEYWGKCLGGQEVYRAFRGTTAFWTIAQAAAHAMNAEIVLFDVGPNLGAINRAALIATDHVVVPLAGDMFSIQGLRNLGPTLQEWREGWQRREAAYKVPGCQRHAARLRLACMFMVNPFAARVPPDNTAKRSRFSPEGCANARAWHSWRSRRVTARGARPC